VPRRWREAVCHFAIETRFLQMIAAPRRVHRPSNAVRYLRRQESQPPGDQLLRAHTQIIPRARYQGERHVRQISGFVATAFLESARWDVSRRITMTSAF